MSKGSPAKVLAWGSPTACLDPINPISSGEDERLLILRVLCFRFLGGLAGSTFISSDQSFLSGPLYNSEGFLGSSGCGFLARSADFLVGFAFCGAGDPGSPFPEEVKALARLSARKIAVEWVVQVASSEPGSASLIQQAI